ncbi:hypothetical protein L489_5291 [Bordetella bronchiseptica 00-P-2730]|nr:hypothetical protein L489_5291 [Bordetella bronchiseptica 00-P-2730]
MWLHWMMLAICIVIFIGVFGVMFYSIWAHRKSRGHARRWGRCGTNSSEQNYIRLRVRYNSAVSL